MIKYKKDLDNIKGTTCVYLVVYGDDFEVDFNKNLSHIFLDSTFVSEDIDQRYTFNYKEKLDNFIDETTHLDDYILDYFPNYSSNPQEVGVLKFLSIPLVSSMRLSFKETVVMNKNNDSFYIYTYRDLNKKGKKFYDNICGVYPEYNIRILTFVNTDD